MCSSKSLTLKLYQTEFSCAVVHEASGIICQYLLSMIYVLPFRDIILWLKCIGAQCYYKLFPFDPLVTFMAACHYTL